MTQETYERFVEENWTGPKTIEFTEIGLGGEAGEVLNEIKKELRDGSHRQEQVLLELGDTLHYLVHLSRLYGYTLSDVMASNISKLMRRQEVVKTSMCGTEV